MDAAARGLERAEVGRKKKVRFRSTAISKTHPKPSLSISKMHLLSSSIFLRNPKPLPILPQTHFKNRLLPNTSIKCRRSEHFEQQRFSRPPETSFPQESKEALPARFFVGHSVYKGKAALTIEPRAPEFTPLDSGAFKLSKEGFVLLQFAPAVGVRQYDWSRKQIFSLSVTEIGAIMGLGAKDSCEFFHDPFKGKSEEGKVKKILKAEPLPDGSGHFFNLSVQNKLLNVDESIYIPITKAEFTVIISAFNFLLPYLLGWHAFANSIKPDDSGRTNNANPQSGANLQ